MSVMFFCLKCGRVLARRIVCLGRGGHAAQDTATQPCLSRLGAEPDTPTGTKFGPGWELSDQDWSRLGTKRASQVLIAFWREKRAQDFLGPLEERGMKK
jgi:hypothetical protein